MKNQITSKATPSRVTFSFLIVLLAGLGLFPFLDASANSQINGAGATFPYPLYSKWFSEYQRSHPAVKINYQSIGSGGGIRQFLEQTVDFGASDAPMNDEQLSKSKTPVVHIPTTLGAVVLTYNLPGVSKTLRFDSEVVSEIYLGSIKKWNDPKITKLNPGVTLPDQAIFVAYRSDGSGTTFVFTDYLSKVSPAWQSKVGTGTAVKWPVGLGGKGNEGVTGLVKQTPGSMGYVELIYAVQNKLPVSELKNQAGQFVTPNLKSVTEAAASVVKSMPADYRVSITNAAGKNAYPIASFTYLLFNKPIPNVEKASTLVAFLNWSMKEGQRYAEQLSYAPLPKSLVQRIEKTIRELKPQK